MEDNVQMRRLIRQIAQKWSADIFECEDGAQALAAYREHLPDWVLMDIEMPVTDGISATRQITAAFPGAKIAIVTDHDTAILREAAGAAGACEYIVKDNLAALKRLLSR